LSRRAGASRSPRPRDRAGERDQTGGRWPRGVSTCARPIAPTSSRSWLRASGAAVDIVQLRTRVLSTAPGRAGQTGPQGVRRSRRAPSSSTIVPTWSVRSGLTVSTSDRTTCRRSTPGSWSARCAGRLSTHAVDELDAAIAHRKAHRPRSTTLRRTGVGHSDQPGRPGTGLGYISEAVSRRRCRCGSPEG